MARWQKREDDGSITFSMGTEGTFTFGPSTNDEKLGRLATEILSYLGCNFDVQWPELRPEGEERTRAIRASHARLTEEAKLYASGVAARDYGITRHCEEALAIAYSRGWFASPKPVNHIISGNQKTWQEH